MTMLCTVRDRGEEIRAKPYKEANNPRFEPRKLVRQKRIPRHISSLLYCSKHAGKNPVLGNSCVVCLSVCLSLFIFISQQHPPGFVRSLLLSELDEVNVILAGWSWRAALRLRTSKLTRHIQFLYNSGDTDWSDSFRRGFTLLLNSYGL